MDGFVYPEPFPEPETVPESGYPSQEWYQTEVPEGEGSLSITNDWDEILSQPHLFPSEIPLPIVPDYAPVTDHGSIQPTDSSETIDMQTILKDIEKEYENLVEDDGDDSAYVQKNFRSNRARV